MSGNSSSGVTISRDMTPEEFAKTRDFTRHQLTAGTLGQGVSAGYQGPFAAQIGGQEQAQLGYLQQLSGINGQAPGHEAAQGALLRQLNPSQQSTAEQSARLSALVNPILRQADTALSDTAGAFAQGGHVVRPGSKEGASSPFRRAAGDVIGRRDEAIVQAGAQLAQQADANQLQAVGQQAIQSQGVFNQAREALSASALPRLVEQLGIDAGQAEFARRMAAMQQALAALGELGAPTLGTFSTQTSAGGGVSF